MVRRPNWDANADLNDVVGQLRVSNEELRTANRLLAILATRGMPQRQAIVLLAALGLQPKQIAQIIDITPNAVRVALHKVRKATAQGGVNPRESGPFDDQD